MRVQASSLPYDILLSIFQWVAYIKYYDHYPGELAQARANMVLWPPRRCLTREPISRARYLASCCLVCTEWHLPALHVLYRELFVRIDEAAGRTLIRNLRKNPEIRACVRQASILSEASNAKAFLSLGLHVPNITEMHISHFSPLQPLDYQRLCAAMPFRHLKTLNYIRYKSPDLTLVDLCAALLLMPALENLGFSSLPAPADISDIPPPPFQLTSLYCPKSDVDYSVFFIWLVQTSYTSLRTLSVDPMARNIDVLRPVFPVLAPGLTALQISTEQLLCITEHLRLLTSLHYLSLVHSGELDSVPLKLFQSPLHVLTFLPHPFSLRRNPCSARVCETIGASFFSSTLRTISIQRHDGIPSMSELLVFHSWCMDRRIHLDVFEECHV